MKQNENALGAFIPEAATDEPASPANDRPVGEAGAAPPDPPDEEEKRDHPRFANAAEEEAYWRGVTYGIRAAGREPGHPHMPADFSLDLSRGGASPDLVSNKLLEAWPVNPADPPARACRSDGWDPDKERRFFETLSNTGVVADACRASGMSRDAAYTRRRSASGRAFALAWDAAILIARGAVADDVLSRARHGVIDRVYRNGELVAERHRYDNRLTMAVLTRLDRQAEGLGENAPVVRAVAQEFDRFLDILPKGVEGAEEFIAARFPAPGPKGKETIVKEPPTHDGGIPVPGSETALLARLGAYGKFGVGLPAETAEEALDPAEMERWTEEQWGRAEFSGRLDRLAESEWPEAARVAGADEANGMCKLRKLYLAYHPRPADPPAGPEDDFGGRSVWQDDAEGEWLTDFHPPEGFDGHEEGMFGEDGYRRSLAPDEQAMLDRIVARDAAERADSLAEQLAAAHAARDRFFRLCAGEAASPGQDSSSSTRSEAPEGDEP
jgi:hypothetical protein